MVLQYLCEKNDSETIFTSNDDMNIQNGIGKKFGYIERAYFMGVIAYFGPRQTNIPHATPNYRHGKSKFEVDYYRQTYFSSEKLAHIRKNWKNRSRSNVLF